MKQIGKWSDTSLLIIVVLKLLSIKELVSIKSMAVAVILVTRVGLFNAGNMACS